MSMAVHPSGRSLARWTCLVAVAGFLLPAGCSDPINPTTWSPVFQAVGGSSANDVYAAGGETVWHFDGRRWLPVHDYPHGFLTGVWAPSGDNVFATWGSGDGGLTGQVLHFDGHDWRMVASAPAALQSVWGSSGSDVYAVGRLGTILHYDGRAWNTSSTGQWDDMLRGIWGSSSQDVFVGGARDSILHYDGARWTRQYTGASSLALWGSSGQDVFAVGGTSIRHYDGASWSPQTSGTTNNLFGVWGSSPQDVFAVGAYGTILHYDGTGWSAQASGTTTQHLYGVWGSSAHDVFAVGWQVILHYDGTRWSAPVSADPANDAWRRPASPLRPVVQSPPAVP